MSDVQFKMSFNKLGSNNKFNEYDYNIFSVDELEYDTDTSSSTNSSFGPRKVDFEKPSSQKVSGTCGLLKQNISHGQSFGSEQDRVNVNILGNFLNSTDKQQYKATEKQDNKNHCVAKPPIDSEGYWRARNTELNHNLDAKCSYQMDCIRCRKRRHGRPVEKFTNNLPPYMPRTSYKPSPLCFGKPFKQESPRKMVAKNNISTSLLLQPTEKDTPDKIAYKICNCFSDETINNSMRFNKNNFKFKRIMEFSSHFSDFSGDVSQKSAVETLLNDSPKIEELFKRL